MMREYLRTHCEVWDMPTLCSDHPHIPEWLNARYEVVRLEDDGHRNVAYRFRLPGELFTLTDEEDTRPVVRMLLEEDLRRFEEQHAAFAR